MSTAPIINMSSLGAGSAASKVGNAENSSGESFGDVLNREVNNSNNNGSGTSDVSNTNNQSNSANSSASSTSSSSSSSSNSTSGANASGSTSSSTGASGKPGKTTSNGSNSANGSDPSNISSAQILALVNNVQLATSGANTTSSSTVPTDKSIGAIAATPTSSTGSASAIIGATISTTAGSDKTVVANTAGAASTFEAALKDAKLPTNATQSQQEDADDNTKSEQSSSAQLVLQNTAAPATSLVLPTAAEKSIQASVTQMDDAAIKVQQAVQTPQPSAVVATQQIAATEQFQANNSNNSLTPQVGSPAWDQALGQKVVWMVGGNQQSASLTLNPPDLGPMQVVLSVNNAHATVTFSSAQPEVRQALENAMPKLREMLGDAGIQLGQASINSGSAQQQNTSSQQNSGNSSQHTSGNTIDTIEAAAASVVRASPLSAGLGLVDTFA